MTKENEFVESLDFLRIVTPDVGFMNIVAIHPKTAVIEAFPFTRETVADVALFLQQHCKFNLYWSTNPLRTALAKKATKVDVAELLYVHADVDDLSEAALERICAYPVPPMCIVASGGGYQVFWRLSEPVLAVLNGDGKTITNIDALEAANRRVLADLDPAHPGTHNLDRIMRLPGTTNWPTKTKLEKGRTPVPARVFEMHAERRAKPEEFLVVPEQAATAPAKKTQDRSADLMRVIRKAVFDGESDDAAIHTAFADHEHVAKMPHPADRRRAIDRCIQKARAALAKCTSAVAELAARHAFVVLMGKSLVMWTDVWELGLPRLWPVDSARTFYRNQSIGNINPLDAWLDSPARRDFTNIVFEPGGLVTPGAFNLFSGWPLDQAPGDCSLMLELLRDVWCGRDEALFKFVLQSTANIVQDPAHKPGTAIAVMGKPGTGKTSVYRYMKRMLGRYAIHVAGSEAVTGRFNDHLASKLYVFGDEAVWPQDKRGVQKLKSYITEETILIDRKMIPVFEVASHARFNFASNADQGAPVELGERRWVPLNVSDARRGDAKWWTAFNAELEGGGPAAFLHHLLNVRVDLDLRTTPKTAALAEQKLLNLDSIGLWWRETLRRDDSDNSGGVRFDFIRFGFVANPRALYDSYLEYCNLAHVQWRASADAVGIALCRRFLPGLVKREVHADEVELLGGVGRRQRVYELPPLPKARAAFEAAIGMPLDWSETSDADIDSLLE
jgi:Family of unknown function (DUF5906)/RepB DNA-primase from phage plasmid